MTKEMILKQSPQSLKLSRTGRENEYTKWWKEHTAKSEAEVAVGGMNLFVSQDVFSPSPETTNSVDFLLRHFPDVVGRRVLDIGTGCGVLAIKAAQSGAREVVATDVSALALKDAETNIARTKTGEVISLSDTDRFEDLPGKFDLIIMNIIFAARPKDTESTDALGTNSLGLHERLIAAIPDKLAPHGSILLGYASFGDIETLQRILKRPDLSISCFSEEKFGVNWYAIEVRRR